MSSFFDKLTPILGRAAAPVLGGAGTVAFGPAGGQAGVFIGDILGGLAAPGTAPRASSPIPSAPDFLSIPTYPAYQPPVQPDPAFPIPAWLLIGGGGLLLWKLLR